MSGSPLRQDRFNSLRSVVSQAVIDKKPDISPTSQFFRDRIKSEKKVKINSPTQNKPSKFVEHLMNASSVKIRHLSTTRNILNTI